MQIVSYKSKNKILNIALLGFGTVGRGVWDLLNMNHTQLKLSSGLEFAVKKILVRNVDRYRERFLGNDILTTDFQEILNDKSIDIVIELTGSDEPAFSYMKSALKSGKHVITANKHVIAHRGEILYSLAKEKSRIIGIEACVCGAIPVIKTILEGLSANRFTEVSGIVNGTSNFIVDKMFCDSLSYDLALKKAQDLGYAEADPTSDVKGFDARNKIAILASIAFNKKIDVERISVFGIDKISIDDFKFAKSMNCTIKLIARAILDNDGVFIEVKPMLVHKSHIFYSISEAGNAVLLKTNCAGDLFLTGQGAGSLPTASAVAGDLISIALNLNDPDYFIVDRLIEKAEILESNPKHGEYYKIKSSGNILEKL